MKKLLLLISLIAFLVTNSFGQLTEAEDVLKGAISKDTVDGWKTGGTAFVGISQIALSNWAAGGKDSYSVNGLFNSFANYKKGKLNWDNTLVIGYGVLKQDGEDMVKTDDKIDLLSKLGYDAFDQWNYAALVNFKTQMAEGFEGSSDVVISKFLAPAYLLGAAGLDYKPSDVFSAFIAPLTGKLTIVNDQALADSGAFGVDPGKKTRGELGGYVRMAFKKDIIENVGFETKLDLFSNYLNNPQDIDINWETQITLKVNKFLSTTIATHMIVDKDIEIADTDSHVQFKEVLAVGFTLNF